MTEKLGVTEKEPAFGHRIGIELAKKNERDFSQTNEKNHRVRSCAVDWLHLIREATELVLLLYLTSDRQCRRQTGVVGLEHTSNDSFCFLQLLIRYQPRHRFRQELLP